MRGDRASAADLQPPLRRLLGQVRRRIRLGRLVRHAARIGPPAAAGGLALVLLSRLTPVRWGEPAALAVGLAAAAAVLGAPLLRPVTVRRAALVADRGLGADDSLVASLELGDRVDPIARAVRARARTVVETARARRAAPVRIAPHWRPLGLTAVLGTVGIVVAVAANPQDSARREREEVRQALSTTAAALDALADVTANAEGKAADPALAKELRDLADALARADDLDKAVATLQRAQADLSAGLTADLLATKAAAAGLDRQVQMLPLRGFGSPNEPEAAVTQLEKAARNTKGMTAEEMRVLANRLALLAEAQRLANPGVAQAMNDASAALRKGDRQGAESALNRAAAAQRDAQGSVAAAERRAAAAGALGQPTGDLQAEADRRAGRSRADGAVDGGSSAGGAGTGRSRAHEFNNDEGSSNDPNTVTGAKGGTGSGASGPAAVVDGGDDSEIMFPELDFDERNATMGPADAPSSGGEVSVSGTASETEEPEQVVDRQDAPSADGVARVPLAQRAAAYQAQATAAMQRPEVPPAVRALVSRYFAGLSEKKG